MSDSSGKIDANDVAAKVSKQDFKDLVRDLTDIGVKELIGAPEVSLDILKDFNTSSDSNCLIGNRWICKGYTCIWVGQSGLGKSAILFQFAMSWALGEPMFGAKPVRPLKNLIIQGENDLGDMSEEYQGILKGSGTECRHSEYKKMIHVYRIRNKTGAEFIQALDAACQIHKPDLVWIDNLFSFAGFDANDQSSVSKFFRKDLDSVLEKHSCAAMVVHHTPKPPRDPKNRQVANLEYAGSGSAEITNAARAVVVITQDSEGNYSLHATKRGPRMGLRHPNGERTNKVHIKHSIDGTIYWTQQAPTVDGNEMNEIDDSVFCKYLTDKFTGRALIAEAIARRLNISKNLCRELVETVIDRHKLHLLDVLTPEKSCGMFIARYENRTLKFKLKENTHENPCGL